MDVEPEIVEPGQERKTRVFSFSGSLPILGALFAGGTMLAAAAVVSIMLFGKVLLISALIHFLWPRVFSPEFTLWVFGTQAVPYWKVLLLCAVGAFAIRWIFGGLRRR